MGEQTEGRPEFHERIAVAYHDWQYGDLGTHDTLTEAARVADAILEALGLEQVGWTATAATIDSPYGHSDCGYEHIFDDPSEGYDEPVYRLRVNGDTQ